MHARPHVAGVNDHGGHAPVAQLHCERAGQEFECRLRRAIRSPAGVGPLRGIAGDVYDEAAPLLQQRNRKLNQRKWRPGVHREQPTEACHFEVHQRGDLPQFRGVIHEDVQTAERARRIDESGAHRRVRNVASHRHHLHPVRRQQGSHPIQRLRAPRRDDQLISPFCQHVRNHRSKATARARDDRHSIR
jgi:hypothetical protein